MEAALRHRGGFLASMFSRLALPLFGSAANHAFRQVALQVLDAVANGATKLHIARPAARHAQLFEGGNRQPDMLACSLCIDG